MFKVVLPKTQEELQKYYQFRYKVMCEELGHIPKNKNYIDIDSYDRHSLHLMVVDEANEVVATTRVIYNSQDGLPTLKYMKMDNSMYNSIPKAYTCELSRVFVDNKVRSPNNTKEIIYKLIAKIYIYTKRHDIKLFYAALEKNFIRLLKILKINFKIIGDEGEFYGLRSPCIISKEEFFKYNPYIN